MNGQRLPAMVDSGAIPTCIALRCVLSSPKLKNLTRSKYYGHKIVDANNNPIIPEFVISVTFELGEPSLLITLKVVVVKDFPFSCIIGQSLLGQCDNWNVDNRRKIMTLNGSAVVGF